MDHEGRFRVRVTIDGPLGSGRVDADVDATYDLRPPPALVAVYLIPFALVAFLWIKLLLKRRPEVARVRPVDSLSVATRFWGARSCISTFCRERAGGYVSGNVEIQKSDTACSLRRGDPTCSKQAVACNHRREQKRALARRAGARLRWSRRLTATSYGASRRSLGAWMDSRRARAGGGFASIDKCRQEAQERQAPGSRGVVGVGPQAH